ncbi:MAG: FecR family protein [Cellulophaga sp.]
MLNKKIETIVIKYLSKSVSIDELIELTVWVNENHNYELLKDFIKTDYLINFNMLDFDTEGEKEIILQKIKRKEKNIQKNKINRVFKYAAIVVIILGLSYTYFVDNFSSQKKQNPVTNTIIQPGKDKAILTLENGSELVIENSKDVKLKGRLLTSKKLVYDVKPISKNDIVKYNSLTIPKGGKFFVILSDGTKVWLNSDSKLKYPINFKKGQLRKVELVYGEAYFDVSPSASHNGSTFKVLTGVQEIEVLGTEFNIKAYQDEDEIVTTLVEGKVTIGNGKETRFLNPSEQSIIVKKEGVITILKVAKTFNETAWKEGYFSFRQKSMKEIMKTLSRWYNIDYVFKNPEKENKSFTGILDRESEITQILTYIQKTNEISFQINNNTIIID